MNKKSSCVSIRRRLLILIIRRSPKPSVAFLAFCGRTHPPSRIWSFVEGGSGSKDEGLGCDSDQKSSPDIDGASALIVAGCTGNF